MGEGNIWGMTYLIEGKHLGEETFGRENIWDERFN